MWMRNLIMSIVLAIIFTWFAVSNSQSVNLTLLIWKHNMSLSLVVLISVLVGVIFTGIVSAAEEAKLHNKIRELEKKDKALEEKAAKSHENAKV